MARDLRQTPESSGLSRSTRQTDKAAQWVAAKPGFAGSIRPLSEAEVSGQQAYYGHRAFDLPGAYRLLEKEGCRYAIRIKDNAVLEREIEHLLKRSRRVVAKKSTPSLDARGARCYNSQHHEPGSSSGSP